MGHIITDRVEETWRHEIAKANQNFKDEKYRLVYSNVEEALDNIKKSCESILFNKNLSQPPSELESLYKSDMNCLEDWAN